MEEEKPIWKHDTVFMTVICFIAYQLGRYSEIIKSIIMIAAIAAALYSIIHLTGISIEIKRADTIFLRIG
jgi:hypothetical protein